MNIPLAHLPENDPERIYASINRGILIAESGYADEAMEIFRQSLSRLIEAGYDRHPYAAVAYTCIGIEYDRIWEFSRSISYHTVAMKILQNHFPGNHPAIAKQLFRLSNSHILYNAGYNRFEAYYFDKPYRWLRKAVDICRENYGIQHPYTGVAYNQLSNLFFYTKDIDSTLCYSRISKDILAQYCPENHSQMVLAQQVLCYTHQRMKSY